METFKKALFKVIVLGDSGVGKSSILQRYVKDKFTSGYKATIGADFMVKDLELDQKLITLQLWDTAGQERYQALGGAYYRGADACILVYDVTRVSTFDVLEKWKDDFLLQTGLDKDGRTVPFLVLGNKTDLEKQREVPARVAALWCKDQALASGGRVSLAFLEVSAKDGTNVEQAFRHIAQEAVKSMRDEEISPATFLEPESIRVSNGDPSAVTKSWRSYCGYCGNTATAPSK